ncbi:hypothetical protein VCRA2119O52_90027 [Vibrio crassostreae]|nr:hypothetical protein VCRA2119O52_90027 [Vibrio crassostreae]
MMIDAKNKDVIYIDLLKIKIFMINILV